MPRVRIGWLKPGANYEVSVTAGGANQGATFVTIGWQPAPGNEPKTFPMRIEPGQKGLHALVCPFSMAYYLVSIDVDVPDSGHAALEVKGMKGADGKDRVFTADVTGDTTYWMEIQTW